VYHVLLPWKLVDYTFCLQFSACKTDLNSEHKISSVQAKTNTFLHGHLTISGQ
jgi:hypothetical protein